MANIDSSIIGGIGSIFRIELNGKYGISTVIIPTPIAVYESMEAGLLLKNGLCVRITTNINNSVKIDKTNQLL